MEKPTGLSKRFGGKGTNEALVYFLLVLMVILFVGSYPNVLPPPVSKVCMLFAEITLFILILWAVYAFQTKPQGSYIIDRYPAELDLLAEIFEKNADEAIQKKISNLPNVQPFYLEKLYSLSMDSFFRECSKRSEIAADNELRFYLLAKMADFNMKADNFALAEECLREALGIQPNVFILWLRLAEVSERLGAGPEAVAAYESALALSPDNAKVKEHLGAQIQRVQTRGPMKQLPIQGATYGSV
jgi:tetratricopeptide (TPR) repeat protein